MECPQEPEESECCNSGCNPCIFDVYQQQLKLYEKWQQNQSTIKPSCLKPLKYTSFLLVKKITQTENVDIYIFEYEGDDGHVIHEPGQHLLIKMKSSYDQNDFTRAYTPIPWNGLTTKQFAALIKLYPTGDMSNCIKRLKIGDVTEWRGPYGDYEINFKEKGILLIAQGTGIAPLFAIIRKYLENEDCETWLKLFYCCNDSNSIYLQDELYKAKDFWNFNYEVFLGKVFEDSMSGKYNEIIHERKLQEEDIKNIYEENDGKNKWTSVLICGSTQFSNEMKLIVEKYMNVPIHVF